MSHPHKVEKDLFGTPFKCKTPEDRVYVDFTPILKRLFLIDPRFKQMEKIIYQYQQHTA